MEIIKKNKVALCAGITGQDGSYLAELLLEKDYIVHGIIRRSSSFNTERIEHLMSNPNFHLHYGDVTDPLNITTLIAEIKPDEIFNLSAQSHVQVSFEVPHYTAQTDALGTLTILEAMRAHCPESKFYQACHDQETKVISNNGIVDYSELKEGDLVYTFNLETKEIELKPIKNIFEYDYDGDMIYIKNRKIDKMVTPNHKLLLKSDKDEYYYQEAGELSKHLPHKNSSKLSLVKPEFSYINAKESYNINTAKKETNKIYKKNITKIPYKGKVWCLEMEDNNNFLVIRNGKVSFCGNSTSELYGGLEYNKNSEGFYDENSPFHPRSPYGVAKLYGFWIIKNYRESYGLFACNGILFNHETLAEFMPVIIKKDELVFIKPISEVVMNDLNKNSFFDKSLNTYQELEPSEDVYIWDKKGWTKILYASGYPHLVDEDNKNPIILNSRNSCYFATGSHECIMNDGTDKKFEDIQIGDSVSLVESFKIFDNHNFDITEDEAELLGFIVVNGNYKDKYEIRLTQKDIEPLEYFEDIFFKLYNKKANRTKTTSGFTKIKNINQFIFSCKEFIDKFQIYNSYKEKVIPYQILNSDLKIKKAFLKGYYKGDGLKKNKTVYEYKSFKTSSSTLAMGLIYLFKEAYDLDYNINVFMHNNKMQYQVNLLSNSRFSISKSKEKSNIIKEHLSQKKSQREISRISNISRTFIRKVQNGIKLSDKHHFLKEKNKVKKILNWKNYSGWFFDLTTESGSFHAGVGHGHIHNSPRRGKTFVTRKITTNMVQIKKGKRDVLMIGNLDAERDWGYAKEYCEGMWLMLQQDEPDDYVLATGKTYKVRTFIEMTAKHLGWEIEWIGEGVNEKGYDKDSGRLLVEVDPKYFRPAEVDRLIGDPSKAKEKLGWEAKVGLEELVEMMVRYDLEHE